MKTLLEIDKEIHDNIEMEYELKKQIEFTVEEIKKIKRRNRRLKMIREVISRRDEHLWKRWERRKTETSR